LLVIRTLTAAALCVAGLTITAGAAGAFSLLPADKTVIASAEAAAPKQISEHASIVAFDHKGAMRTLRQGTNNFTCMPDDPTTPGNDPICVDAAGLEWLQALSAGKEPPAGKIGVGYMMAGGSDASNTDPSASAPADGAKWIITGPHMVIFNLPASPVGYPDKQSTPDTNQPFVMYGGTPYVRLMLPIK
jgi:hypothetical protein